MEAQGRKLREGGRQQVTGVAQPDRGQERGSLQGHSKVTKAGGRGEEQELSSLGTKCKVAIGWDTFCVTSGK